MQATIIVLNHYAEHGHRADTIGIWFVATIAVFVLAAILWGKKS